MDKRNLLERLAAALGRGRTDKTEDQTTPPAGEAPIEASGDEGPEPQRIGTMMPSMAPPRDDDLARQLADVVAVAERAGQMLEAQAKRQQTAGDAVAELATRVTALADQLAAQTETLGALQSQVQRAGERLSALAADEATARDDLAAQRQAIDDLHAALVHQMRAHAEALADIQTRVHGGLNRLQRWIVLAVILAAAAFVAAALVLIG